MSRYHARQTPAGVLPRSLKTLDLFQTDVVNGVLYLDERAGLGVISAATQLMAFRCRKPYVIQRVSTVEMRTIKRRKT
jgi:hypothetical protein